MFSNGDIVKRLFVTSLGIAALVSVQVASPALAQTRYVRSPSNVVLVAPDGAILDYTPDSRDVVISRDNMGRRVYLDHWGNLVATEMRNDTYGGNRYDPSAGGYGRQDPYAPRYNDRYGHAVGDRVLKAVATSLAESLAGHFVGRWGGEEFLIVAECDVEAAVASLESAKEALGKRQFKLRETDEPMGRISYSAGVARLCGDTRAKAIELADAALYSAKETGRDKVLAA